MAAALARVREWLRRLFRRRLLSGLLPGTVAIFRTQSGGAGISFENGCDSVTLLLQRTDAIMLVDGLLEALDIGEESDGAPGAG